MASTPIEVYYDPGKSLTCNLYPRGSDTVAAGSVSLTEATNRDGVYTGAISANLSDYHTVHIIENSRTRAIYDIYMLDDTSTKYAQAVGSAVTQSDIDSIKAKTDDLTFTNANQVDCTVSTMENDVITAAAYDESTAFPLTSADTGSTQVARTGADGDTLQTLSAQNDATLSGIAGVQAQINTRFTEIKGATWSSTTDTLEKIRDRGDAAWTTATGFSTFDATTDTVDVGKINGSTDAATNLQYLNDAVIPLTVDDATFTPTTTAFETDGTITADDTLIGMAGTWFNSGGTPANTGTYFIENSEGTTTNANNKLKITTETMPAAPANGDIFVVLGSKVR